MTERTPLHPATGAPMYVFSPNPGRLYRNRVRHFQCCVCASLLAIFVLGVVIAVSYSINGDIEDRNSTNPNATEMAWQQLQVLLSTNWPIDDEPPQGEWPAPGPSQEKVAAAVAAGSTAALLRMRLESAMPQMPVDSPSYRHQMAVATGAAANTRARAGFATDEATKMLVKDIGKAPGGRGPRVSAPWQPDDVCADEDGVDAGGFPPCPPAARGSPWRAQDGRCNNLAHPWLGAALRTFRRVLPADYADGVSAPRTGRGGSSLPSAREVSITVHRPQYRDDAALSILLAVWGQFIDHDITATALSKRSTDGGVISCCYAAQSSGLKAHPECFPVMLGPGDPFFEQYNVTCMEFVRSAPAPACRFGPREQLNQATSFLDASVVYGPSEELMKQLRSGIGGRLRMLTTDDGRELLPASTDPNDGCNREEESSKGRYCFFSGDARGNENLHLTTMHLLLARQHNRLARAMQERNPSWGDERLFQEARRILSAQMQHITYSEFVPILLGNDLMTKLELHPLDEGYSRDYDPKIDPRVANVFAAAAFRFAHTLLPGLMRMISNTSSEYVELHKVLFNPFALYAGEGPVLRGALNPGLLRFDPHFSPQVSEHLFERSAPQKGAKGPCGLDLVSLNIQRGRDHGLPPYPVWRRHCGFSEPQSFGDLQGIFDDDSLSRIATIFKSVDDIDPYSGMLAEMPIHGGMLGPTLSCILSDQFVRLRRGDRYWYETGELPQAFSPEQLQEVRKTSLAQLLCDTSDSVTSIQRWVLRAPGDNNPRVPCSSLPRLNIDPWKGSPDPAPPTPLGPAVHIQGSSDSARSFGPGVPPTGDIAAGTVMMLPLRLGAYISSARISSSAGHAWYAAFPLELPLPLFDSISPGRGRNVAPPMTAGAHGILWEGTLVHSSQGFLKFTGEFSLPKYIHGEGDANFSIQWINGDFEFQLQVLWNTSDISALNIDGSYSSPVFVGGRKKYASLQNETTSKLFDVTGEFRESPSLDIDPVAKKAPIILLGTFSPDGSKFLWSGNVSTTIPDVVPATPWSKSSYWSEARAEVPLSPMPWIPRSPEVQTLSVSAKVSSALQLSIHGGSVTLSSNGSSDSVWDGTLPLSIPTPESKNIDDVSSSPKVAYGSGLTWDATLQRIDNTTLNVRGKFSFPIFVKNSDTPFSMEWKDGNFSFDFSIIWNIASLDDVFQEGQSYSSPLYFLESKSTDTVNDIIVGMQESKLVQGSAELQFVATSVAEAANLPKVPIILRGTFSNDKTHFTWNGNAVIVFPTAMKFQPLQMSPKETLDTVAIGASVLSGSIVGEANDQTSSLWRGELPMPIRRPDIITRGVTWRGELSSTSPVEAQLQGSFAAVLPGEPNSTFPFILYQGKVSLQLGLLWNVSIDELLPKGVTAFSPIYLRGSTAPDDAEGWFQSDEEHTCLCSYMSNVQAPKDSLIVPIILQGAYSSDLSTFWWSGKTLLVFPKPIIPPEVMVKARETLILTHSTHKTTPSLTSWYGVPWENQAAPTQPGIPFMRPLRLGGTVRSGSIRTTAGRAWSGSLPLQLKLPLFDTIGGPVNPTTSPNVPEVYAHGILWEGTISSPTAGKVSFYGQFSMPRYVHKSGGLSNFSIQWINGDFDFDIDLLWNTSDVTGLAVQGSYSSPLFLNAERKYKYLINETMNSVANVEGALSQLPSLTPSPSIKKSPFILHGMYSPDKESFLWSGNVTVVIPDIVPVPSWTTNSLWSDDNGSIAFPGSPLVPENAHIENLAAIDGTSYAMGVTITGGHVTVASNETNISLWDGSLPLSIPMQVFDNVKKGFKQSNADSERESKASYSSGVMWEACLERVADNKLHVEGNFSVPIFGHGPDTLFEIDWKMGVFDLDISLLWNFTSLDEVIQEGIKYSSPVFFSVSEATDTISDTIVTLQESSGVEGNVELQFVADAVAEAAAARRAPIILMGSFSSDRSQFLWNGNATIFLPTPIGLTTLLQNKISTGSETKTKNIIIGANVLSGSVVAGTPTTAPSTSWNGELPVPIRRPDLLSRGIIWRGTIQNTSLMEAKIHGNFSAMWPSTEGATYPFTLYKGMFSIELGLLWNVSLDKILSSDISVYSPIYLHASTRAPQSDSWFAIAEDLGREEKQSKSPPEAVGAIFVPIILQGSYSPDLTTFWWNGRVIIPFPGPSSNTHVRNIARNEKNLILSSPQFSIPNTLSKKEAGLEVSNFRPLRLGATVSSGSITTSMGKVWSGSLPLEIPLPLFDSVVTSGDSSSSTPIYSHGILWEGSLYASSEGYVSLSGKFSMPQYIHGGGMSNFSIQWVNGNFIFDLAVIWNSSDVRNLNVQGSYSSPLYTSAKKYYSYLQHVRLAKLSDLINDIKLTSSVKLESVSKKAPLILLGTYSPSGKSFLWSGNISLTIPDAVPVPSWTSVSKIKELSPEEPSVNNVAIIPISSVAMGISVKGGSVNVLENRTTTSWWNGSLPLSISSSIFNRDLKVPPMQNHKNAPLYATGLVWEATVENPVNATIRVSGNYSVPVFEHKPGGMFSIDWKHGDFSLDFILDWNRTSLDYIFKTNTKYTSPVYFRVSNYTNALTNIELLHESNDAVGDTELQFVSESIARAKSLPQAPIVLFGNYSADYSSFHWYGSALIIVPAIKYPTKFHMSISSSSASPIDNGSKTVGGEVVGGSISVLTEEMSLSTLWNGELPFPIRRPDVIARGITWKGEFLESSRNETKLEGTFSTTWPSPDGVTAQPLYKGNFSLKIDLLWYRPLIGLLPPGAIVYSPIYLKGTRISNMVQDSWYPDINEITEPSSNIRDVATNLQVPIILQGTYSPDLSTFWWTGRVVLSFPPSAPWTESFVQAASSNSGSVGAIVTSGVVANSDGSKLWNGALPVTLSPVLKSFKWKGSVSPAVGGTVELRGMFSKGKTTGNYAFVLIPLWNTPITDRINPGMNYSSNVIMRDADDPALPVLSGAQNGNNVPIILLGSFSPDKSTFKWEGSVLIGLPKTV